MKPDAVTCLLDVNVLLALAWPQHVHHGSAHAWYKRRDSWATCPLTQIGFVRVSSADGAAREKFVELLSLKDLMRGVGGTIPLVGSGKP